VGTSSGDKGRQAAPAVIVGAQNTEDQHLEECICLLTQSGNLFKRQHSGKYNAAYTKLFMVKANGRGVGRSSHTAEVNFQALVFVSSVLKHRTICYYHSVGADIVGIVNRPKALFELVIHWIRIHGYINFYTAPVGVLCCLCCFLDGKIQPRQISQVRCRPESDVHGISAGIHRRNQGW
jgi:hypothetical protein